jgi:hypothetical protein
MAYGSMGKMRGYSEKVFDKEARLSRMTDLRVDPKIPLGPVLATWQWGMVRRTPSTERIGDLLLDPRWRKLVGLKAEDGGSPDRAAEILDGLSIDEWNEMMLEDFFIARRAGILGDDGLYGKRCAAVDLNELFKSESIHCPQCQVREKTVQDAHGEKRKVLEYYHQAVALTWVSGELPFVIGWELLAPGEGELTGALRLLGRLLPRLQKSLDFVMGDALYCCRPFFELVCGAGLQALAISSGNTEMDQEIELLKRTDPPRIVEGLNIATWEMESEAWRQDLKRNLRVIHCERRYEAPDWKHERKELRVVTSAPIDILPSRQGWKVGRARWTIENGTFNILTRDYSLEHNYHHNVSAMVGLLAMRSFGRFLTLAYWNYATARSTNAPKRFVKWFQDVVIEDWVRYLDRALINPDIPQG